MPRSNHELLSVVTALLVGILVGGSIVGVTLWPRGSTSGTGCRPSAVVANITDALTPLVVLNSPFNTTRADWSTQTSYLGNGTNFTFPAWNGSVWGFFNLDNWSIQIGAGSSQSGTACTSTFFARVTSSKPQIGVPLGSYLNDSAEPTYFRLNGTSGPVYYSNGFSRETFSVSTCGKGSLPRGLTSQYLVVTLPFTYRGVQHTVDATIVQETSFRYVFPGGAGSWAVDNLSAPGGPGGGWAFSYLGPC